MKEKLQRGSPRIFGKLFFSIFSILFFSVAAYSQNVTGTVSDETGKGLSGVTVTVKGSSVATTTDASGRYTVRAPANAVLVFSSVGFAR